MAKQPKPDKPIPQPRPSEGKEIGGRPAVTHNDFILICERYSETGLAIRSCEDLGFNYSTVMGAIKMQLAIGDTTWQDLWDHSFSVFKEKIDEAILERGMKGTPTKFIRDVKTGELIVTERTFSDRMLELAAKANNPMKYRDYAPPAGVLGVETQDIFAELTPKAKREIRAIIVRDLEEQRLAAAEGRTVVTEVEDAEFTEVEPERLEHKGDEQDG